MPTSRPGWNGYLKLSFVSCPIALYPAISTAERLSFREVNRRTGHRLKHKLVDSVTGEEVVSSDKVRGYETASDEYVMVEDREIEQARRERPPPGSVELASPPATFHDQSPSTASRGAYEQQEDETAAGDRDEDKEEIAPSPRPANTRTIEIERFIPIGQVDEAYLEKPYYLVPRGEISDEAFAAIREAMVNEKAAGLARIVLSSRERPFLVAPLGRGLRGTTLRFTQDIRPAEEFFEGIPTLKLPAEIIKLAQRIIRAKSAEFDPAMLEDHYRAALVRILRSKHVKRTADAPAAPPSRENVISLIDALRRSIAAQRTPKEDPAGSRASRKSRTRTNRTATRAR